MRHLLRSLAGRDSFLADHSSTAEQKMFNALGLLVLVITLVTFASTAYALFLINQDRNPDSPGFHFGFKFAAYFAAPLITVTWSLIVFNFYRFSLSSSTAIKNSGGIKNMTRLLIEIFFGIMFGITLSVPISVSISHEELKDSLLGKELSVITTLEEGVDQKYQKELQDIYLEIAIASNRLNIDTERVTRIEKLKQSADSPLNEAKATLEESTQRLDKAKQKAIELRENMAAEKKFIEKSVRSNDGLITNLQKALAQNKYLIILITLFICTILIFPSIYQAYYIPGIYDHLVEYKNHIVLAKHGVLPHANSIFIKTDEVKVAYNMLPEELLREEVRMLNESFKKEQSEL
jgi:hypothetical protein